MTSRTASCCTFLPPFLVERLGALDDADVAASGRHTATRDAELRARRAAPTATTRPAQAPAEPGAAWQSTTPTTAATCPATWCARPAEPASGTPPSTRPATGADRVAGPARRPRPLLLRRPRRGGGRERALRAGLRQRLLGRHPARLRRRRRHGLRPVHPADRRARPRALPRGHAVHRGIRLPGPVRRPQRVDLGLLRLLRQAAAPRSGRRDGRLADREGLFLPGVRAGRCGRWPTPGTAYDDPRLGKDPQVGHDGRLRPDHRRQRRGAHQLRHPQQGLPARRHRASVARRGQGPAGSGTPR